MPKELRARDPQTRMAVLEPYSRTLCTDYEWYGVRRVPYFKGTTFITEYGDFFENEVQGVRRVRKYVLVSLLRASKIFERVESEFTLRVHSFFPSLDP